MRKSILAGILVGFAVLLVTLLVVSMISLGSIDSLRAAGKDQLEWATMTKELGDIPPAVLLAENGRRGFILMRDPNALIVYREGVESTKKEITEVHALVRNHPEFVERVAELSRIVDQKMLNLHDSMDLFQRDDNPRMQDVFTDSGTKLTQRIRSSIEALTNEILKESEQRGAVVARRTSTAKGIIILFGLLAVVGVGLSVYIISRQLTARVLFEKKQAELIEQLSHALGEVKTLSGLLPICASCKKIRSDSGYWTQIEVYLTEHSEAHFSHGLCDECAAKLYPDFFVHKESRSQSKNNGGEVSDSLNASKSPEGASQ